MKIAFIGHRNIVRTRELCDRLRRVVELLIEKDGADTFLFGSRGDFNSLCYEVVTELKEKYSHIRRVYVRAEYEYINRDYADYLHTLYEESFFPSEVHGAGVLSYIRRNEFLIDMCNVLVVYCDMNYNPQTGTGSGTKRAVAYAERKNKRIINLFCYCGS